MSVSLIKRPRPYVTRLAGWDRDPQATGIPQRAYGELLALAIPVVRHYLSDLFHDAVWLRDNLTDDSIVTFHYSVRESGTWLVTSTEWIIGVRQSSPESRIWTVAIVCDARGSWDMAFSEWLSA